jgi:aryl-alcohol dehydrogenase-like predicted oxidoreductase
MQYTNLGQSGLKVSRLCIGCMTFGSKKWREWIVEEQDARKVIQGALELGINFFDTADMYSDGVSEEILGRALNDFCKREEVIIGSKVFNPMGDKPTQKGLSRKHIFEAVDASLQRLKTDYIDLYQIHRFDYETPIEETLEALNDLVRMGKVLYLGASSMYAWQFAQMIYTARAHGWSTFVSMQNHYNLIYREEEREMNPFCRQEGIGIIPWSPLARGFLAGNRPDKKTHATVRARTDDFARSLYFNQQDFSIAQRVIELAQKRNVKPIQIALAWILNQPGITSPIVGVKNLEQLNELVEGLDIQLEQEELSYLQEPYQPKRIYGHS